MLIRRNLVTIFRTPEALLPPMAISVFFLVIYKSTLGKAAGFLPEHRRQLPGLYPAALYCQRFAVRRRDRRAEPGARHRERLLRQTAAHARQPGGVAARPDPGRRGDPGHPGQSLVVGCRPAAGPRSGHGLGWRAGSVSAWRCCWAPVSPASPCRRPWAAVSAAATQGASFLFFPLTFLTATFVPLALLDGWLKTAARLTRSPTCWKPCVSLLNTAGILAAIWQGVLACLILATAMYILAAFALRVRTSRK